MKHEILQFTKILKSELKASFAFFDDATRIKNRHRYNEVIDFEETDSRAINFDTNLLVALVNRTHLEVCTPNGAPENFF